MQVAAAQAGQFLVEAIAPCDQTVDFGLVETEALQLPHGEGASEPAAIEADRPGVAKAIGPEGIASHCRAAAVDHALRRLRAALAAALIPSWGA